MHAYTKVTLLAGERQPMNGGPADESREDGQSPWGTCRSGSLSAVALLLSMPGVEHQRAWNVGCAWLMAKSGLAARTIARRMSSVRSLYDYLVVRGDTSLRVNPVPHGLATR
jgi:hypothetical protein